MYERNHEGRIQNPSIHQGGMYLQRRYWEMTFFFLIVVVIVVAVKVSCSIGSSGAVRSKKERKLLG